jgi:hypothetical protein
LSASLASNSIARSMKRNEFRFLISQRVPSGSPARRTETFASQRNDPSCMLPSHTPIQRTSACNVRAYATASLAPRRSGSLTISSSGVPARLRSIPVIPWKSSCSDLPASSSRCARVMRIVFCPSGSVMTSAPCCTIGISYWLIW